jgi:hypothetical protein
MMRKVEVAERAAGRMRKPQRGGTEVVETERARSRPRASNYARRCYVGARRTRTGRRWLLACLTTCLLVVEMCNCDPDGGLLAVWDVQDLTAARLYSMDRSADRGNIN